MNELTREQVELKLTQLQAMTAIDALSSPEYQQRDARAEIERELVSAFAALRQRAEDAEREREEARDNGDLYKSEIDRADALLNRFGIPNIAHECGDMLKPVDERIELVFVQMDTVKRQLAAALARVKELEERREEDRVIGWLSGNQVASMANQLAKFETALAERDRTIARLRAAIEQMVAICEAHNGKEANAPPKEGA